MKIDGYLIHDRTKIQMDSILNSSSIHAVGIYGAKGSGRAYLAKIIASKLINTPEIDSYPYFIWLDCANDTGIEQIREIKHALDLKVPGDKKINRCIVLESIESLGHEAQNALLKSIEEPPAGTIIIAICASRLQLKQTIVSRMQWIYTRPIIKRNLKSYLGNTINEKDFENAYLLSDGNASLFLSLINKSDNFEEYKKIIEQAKYVLGKTKQERLGMIDSLTKDKEISVDKLLEAMSRITRAVVVVRIKSGKDITASNLLIKLQLINKTRRLLNNRVSEKLALTNLFYKF